MDDEVANAQVDAFLSALYLRFGVRESDIKQWVRVLPAVIESHERSARYGEMVAKALIGSLVGSLVIALFGSVGWAVVHFIQSLSS